MARTQRITANLPEDLLREAMEATGAGITETLTRGLGLLRRAAAHERAMALRGKLRWTSISRHRVSGVVADTSVWIGFFAGRPQLELEAALQHGSVVLPPVVAELISGARRPPDRTAIARLLTELAVHETPVDHWIRVGDLRRLLLDHGISVSTPDAHVAQCALDRDAVLLTHDKIFARIASRVGLKLAQR